MKPKTPGINGSHEITQLSDRKGSTCSKLLQVVWTYDLNTMV